MAFSSVLQMYLGWANSILHEDDDIIDGFHQLRDGKVFCKLLDLLNGSSLQDETHGPANQDAMVTVQAVLDYLLERNVQVKTTAKAIVDGELKGILDVMWALILHFTIHTQARTSYQRTVWIGKKLLLQWCGEELTNSKIDPNTTLAVNFCNNNYLSSLIYKFCPFDFRDNNEEKHVMNLTNALIEAEDKLGIKKSFLSPADVISGNVEDHALLLYLALLKRKATQVIPLSNRTQSTMPFTSEDEDEIEEEETDEKREEESKEDETVKTKSTRTLQEYLNSLEDMKKEDAEQHDSAVENGNTTNTSLTSISENTLQDSDTDLGASPPQEGSESLRRGSPGIAQSQKEKEVVSSDDGLNEARKQLVETLLAVDACEVKQPEKKQEKIKRVGSQERLSPALKRRSASGSGDELLDVLEAIGQECNELRDELAEARKRERSLQFQLEESTRPGRATQEEKVIGKLVQELEMLRSENRRLFRETATAKSATAQERKTVEQLQRTAEKLQMEVDNLKSDNFALKFKERLKEVHDESSGVEDGSPKQSSPLLDRFRKGTPNGDIAEEILHIEGLPDTTDVRELKQHLASAKFEGEILRNKLDVTNSDMTAKLNQTFEDLKTTKEESQKVEQELKLAQMAAETNKVEMESLKSKIEHLQSALVEAEEKNNKLTGELEELRALLGTDSSPRKLQRDLAVLKEKLQLAEEDREILKQELRNYRVTQSIMESSSSYRDKYTRSGENGSLYPRETVSRQPGDRDEFFTAPKDDAPVVPSLDFSGSGGLNTDRKHKANDAVSLATLPKRRDPVDAGGRSEDQLLGPQYFSSEREKPIGRDSHTRRHTVGEPVGLDTKPQESSIFRGRNLYSQGSPRGEQHSLRTRSLSPADRRVPTGRGHRSLPREPKYRSLDFSTDPTLRMKSPSPATRSTEDVAGRGSLPRQQRDYSAGRSDGTVASRREGSGDRSRGKQSAGRWKESPGRGKRETSRTTEGDGHGGKTDLGGNIDSFDDAASDGLSERSFRAEDFVNEFTGTGTDRSMKRREVESWLKEEEEARPDSEYTEIGYLSLRNVVYGKLPIPDEPDPTESYTQFGRHDDYADVAYGKLPNTVVPKSRQEKSVPASTVVPPTSRDTAAAKSDRKYRPAYASSRGHAPTTSSAVSSAGSSTTKPYTAGTYTPATSYAGAKPYSSSSYPSTGYHGSSKFQTGSTYGKTPSSTAARTYTRPTYTPVTTSSPLKSHTTDTTYSTPTTQTTAKTYASDPRYGSNYGYQPYSSQPKTTTGSTKYESLGYSPPEKQSQQTEISGRVKYGYLPGETYSAPVTNTYSSYSSKYDSKPLNEIQDVKIPERRSDMAGKNYSTRPPRSPQKSHQQSEPKVNGPLEMNGGDAYSYLPRSHVNPESPSKASEISSVGPLSMSELQHSPQVKARNSYQPVVPLLRLNDDGVKVPPSTKYEDSSYASDSKLGDLTLGSKVGEANYASTPKFDSSFATTSKYDGSKYDSSKYDDSTYSKLRESDLTSGLTSTAPRSNHATLTSNGDVDPSKPEKTTISNTGNSANSQETIPLPDVSLSRIEVGDTGSLLLDKFRNVNLTREQEDYANSLIEKYTGKVSF